MSWREELKHDKYCGELSAALATGSPLPATVRGLPTLLFCVLHAYEDTAFEILKELSFGRYVLDLDSADGAGTTALHAAAALGEGGVVEALLAAKASPFTSTVDVWVCGGVPGGRSPLHAAVEAASSSCVLALLDASADPHQPDWTGVSPRELAAVVAPRLAWPEEADVMTLGTLEAVRVKEKMRCGLHDVKARRQSALDISARPELHGVIHCPALMRAELCAAIVAAAEAHGWSSGRHVSFPTTDVPLRDLLDHTVRRAAESWVKDCMLAQFDQWQVARLSPHDAFVAKYACDGSAQSSLDFHRDGTLLAAVVALNDAFLGGGTVFETGEQLPLHCGIGDAFLFSGQRLHAGKAVTSGCRYILAVFVHEHTPMPAQKGSAGSKHK
mmetsp:Transcript_12205/g.29015  ORF Transcript_12205/g.29015 Transcript_12205/m.29015 type:complete len:386 (-) Transcript_12205:14-1171(-)